MFYLAEHDPIDPASFGRTGIPAIRLLVGFHAIAQDNACVSGLIANPEIVFACL